MEKTKILLVVGDATNVFVVNFAKWLKIKMDCNIAVFSYYSCYQNPKYSEYFDKVDSTLVNSDTMKLFDHRFIWRFKEDYKRLVLKRFLKGQKYDVIHCHWLRSDTVYCTDVLRKHTDCLIGTFWGGEYVQQSINGSQEKYLEYLEHFLRNIDFLINSEVSAKNKIERYPFLKEKVRFCILGASGLDYMRPLVKGDRKDSKSYFNIPIDKVCVQIGYSGKSIHQHLEIIKELSTHSYLKGKIHILNPMTRDADITEYVQKVDKALESCGISYTTLKDRFLSDEEVAKLRYATDVVLQLSTFDGFSRSIVEAFCAKSLVIYGDWLGYEKHLNKFGYEAFAVSSIKDGTDKLAQIIDKIDNYKEATEKNSEIGFRHNLWEFCIDDWINVYKEGQTKRSNIQ